MKRIKNKLILRQLQVLEENGIQVKRSSFAQKLVVSLEVGLDMAIENAKTRDENFTSFYDDDRSPISKTKRDLALKNLSSETKNHIQEVSINEQLSTTSKDQHKSRTIKRLESKFAGNKSKVENGVVVGIFRFNKPEIMDYIAQFLLLIQCFHLGLVVTIFAARAAYFFPSTAWLLIILQIVPDLIGAFYMLPKFIQDLTFVHYSTSVNPNIYGKIVNRMERIVNIKRQLLIDLSSRFAGTVESPRDLTQRIFKELDCDNDGYITFKELRKGLSTFNVFLTDEELLLFFTSIETDKKSGTFLIFLFYKSISNVKKFNKKAITLQEFFKSLFEDSNLTKTESTEEKKRMKSLGNHELTE